MNKKGIYTATLALVAITVIAAMSFSNVANVQAKEGVDKAQAIIDLKWEWQNAYSLLWNSGADAVADAGFASACVFDADAIKNTAEIYFADTLAESLKNCSIDNVSVQDPPDSLDEAKITFDLECRKELNGMSINYKKGGRILRKKAYYYTDGTGACFVDVKDVGTGYCEVDKIDNLLDVGCEKVEE